MTEKCPFSVVLCAHYYQEVVLSRWTLSVGWKRRKSAFIQSIQRLWRKRKKSPIAEMASNWKHFPVGGTSKDFPYEGHTQILVIGTIFYQRTMRSIFAATQKQKDDLSNKNEVTM